MAMTRTPTTVAISWVSFNHDPFERAKDGSYQLRDGGNAPGPTLELLFNPDSPVCERVTKLYLLARRPKSREPGSRPVHPREEDVVEALVAELSKRSNAPEVEVFWWETDASPTDHRELFRYTAQKLTAIRQANPRALLVVNLSPGTPAMQTVMLLALQARLAGDHVQAFQGTPRDKRRVPADVVREVPWNLLSELAATPTGAAVDSTGRGSWDFDNAQSRQLREVAARVKQFGGVPFPVLIIGARGTGKTAVARKLRAGFREWGVKAVTDWAFHLNCAEFRGDPSILRSALFGYVKGAHSTALRDEMGLLEKAAADCVFLDEIHWMDAQAQGLLLLALQRGGSIRRIGSDKTTPASFRLIAATNQPWDVLRDRLTPDFLDRISDLVIELPDLRDCRDDLRDLWREVVRRACEELCAMDSSRAVGKSSTGDVDAMIAEFQPHHARVERDLRTMQLPGNIRDLERLARRLLVAGGARARGIAISDEMVRVELARLRKEERTEDGSSGRLGFELVQELPTRSRCEDAIREVYEAGRVFPAQAAIDGWELRLHEAAREVTGSGAKAAGVLGLNPRTANARFAKLTAASEKAGGTSRRSRPG